MENRSDFESEVPKEARSTPVEIRVIPQMNEDVVYIRAMASANTVGELYAQQEGETLWLSTIDVMKRGSGIGSKLLDNLDNAARYRGCDVIEGVIIPDDSNARPWLPNFYKRNGYDVTSDDSEQGKYHLKKMLSPGKSAI